METSFTIDIYNYFNEGEIEQMVRDEVQCYVRNRVRDSLRTSSISSIISNVAGDITMRILAEQDADIHQKIADKTLECFDELSLYCILRNDDNGKKSKGQQVLDECVEEARPKIQQKIDEIVENKLNANWLVDEVCDAFYNKLYEQLTKRQKSSKE